jgi:hypothetical protein
MKQVPQKIEEMSKTVIRFALNVAAGASGTLTYNIRKPCTIEGMHVRFYFGNQLSVRVNPYLLKTKERQYNIIDFPAGTKKYIDGEDESLDYNVSVPCDVDDEIVIEYTNTDGANGYDIAVSFELDFMGGALRIGGV